MRKVMCVDDSEFKRNGNKDVPAVGDICTVTDSYVDVFDNNDPVYEFAEYSNHIFSQRYFATLPDSTADDMKEVEKEAIVNLETVAV